MATPPIIEHARIPGVQLVQLSAHGDERGRFTEIFRKEWFPQRNWENLQINRSDSQSGVLRGLHYHFKQIDYWFLQSGTVRIGLVDLRPDSPAYMAATTMCISAEENTGIFIPIGVAHGFHALSDVTLLYVVDNYYDGRDEFGLAWNDPDVGPDWENSEEPILSERDAANPLFQAIPANELPAA